MLNQQEIDKYQKALSLEQERLTREINNESKPGDFGTDVEGEAMEEEASEGEDFANRLAIAQTLKDRLAEVEDALNRIGSGKYGVCTQCHQDISRETLDIAPESALCSDCKMKVAA